MITKSYKNLSDDEKNRFFQYLSSTLKETNQPAAANMWDDNWESKPATLPYLLECNNRFSNSNGDYHIVYDQENIVACGGVYKSNFDPKISFAGVRTWVDSKYRNRSILREYMFPIHKEWSVKNNFKIIALSFNQYNKNIISIFKRSRLGESGGRISSRQPNHLFYSGLNEVSHLVTIQYTPQWVIYEKLDPNWDFDWNTIRSDV